MFFSVAWLPYSQATMPCFTPCIANILVGGGCGCDWWGERVWWGEGDGEVGD